MSTLQVTLLGTGTSHGVPVIGCNCPVCLSADPRDRRNRCGAYLVYGGHGVLIDAPPELRLAALTYGVRRVEALLLTHAHFDHAAGLDDLRRFNEINGGSLPVYGNADTLAKIRQRWDYVFNPETQVGGGLPSFELVEAEAPFGLFGRQIMPIPAWHGRLPILGWRIGGFAYVTDCSELPPASRDRLRDLEVLILGAIRRRPHETHFNLEQALAAIETIQPGRAFLTHITHDLGHAEVSRELPAGVALAHDGLKLEMD